MAEQTGTSWLARRREAKRTKKELTGDSPERLAEHHRPKRDWGDMVAISSPGGQRHISPKGGRR
jgi:hypothetical protein